MLVLIDRVAGIDSIFLLRWTPANFIALLSALTFCNHRLQDGSYQHFRFTIVFLPHSLPNSSNTDSIYSTFFLLFVLPHHPSIPPQGLASCVFLDYFRQKIPCYRFYLLCGLQRFISLIGYKCGFYVTLYLCCIIIYVIIHFVFAVYHALKNVIIFQDSIWPTNVIFSRSVL